MLDMVWILRQLDLFGSHKQKTALWRRCLRTPNIYYHEYACIACGGIHSNVTYTSNSSNNNNNSVFFPCRHRKKLNTAMIDSFFDKLLLAFDPIRSDPNVAIYVSQWVTRWRRVVSVAFFFSTTYGSAYSATPAAAAVHRHYFFHKTHRSRHRHRSILPQFRLLAPDYKTEGSRLLHFILY